MGIGLSRVWYFRPERREGEFRSVSFFTSLLECFVRLLRAFCVQTCPPTHSHAFTAVVSGIFSGDELCWRLSARLECCLCSVRTRANVGTGAKSLGHQQHPPGAGRSGFSRARVRVTAELSMPRRTQERTPGALVVP